MEGEINYSVLYKFDTITSDVEDILKKGIQTLNPATVLIEEMILKPRKYDVIETSDLLSNKLIKDLSEIILEYSNEFEDSDFGHEYYFGKSIVHRNCIEIIQRLFSKEKHTGDLIYSAVIKLYKGQYYYWKFR